MSSHVLLVLACLALIGTVAAQDWAIVALRSRPISDGLAGRMHGYLDAAFALLCVAMLFAFVPLGGWTATFAIIGGLGLVGSAVSATLATWVNALSDNQHAKIHTISTAVIFVGAFGVCLSLDEGWMWWLTGAGIAVPAAVYTTTRRTDYTEKVGVLLLCAWLVAWAV